MKGLAKYKARFLSMKVGEQFVITWDELPGPRPGSGARFGIGVRVWRADPKHEGLLITRELDLKPAPDVH